MTTIEKRLILNQQIAWLDKYEHGEISWEELRGFYAGCRQTLLMQGNLREYENFLDEEEAKATI